MDKLAYLQGYLDGFDKQSSLGGALPKQYFPTYRHVAARYINVLRRGGKMGKTVAKIVEKHPEVALIHAGIWAIPFPTPLVAEAAAGAYVLAKPAAMSTWSRLPGAPGLGQASGRALEGLKAAVPESVKNLMKLKVASEA